jgi:hypothetical protein
VTDQNYHDEFDQPDPNRLFEEEIARQQLAVTVNASEIARAAAHAASDAAAAARLQARVSIAALIIAIIALVVSIVTPSEIAAYLDMHSWLPRILQQVK